MTEASPSLEPLARDGAWTIRDAEYWRIWRVALPPSVAGLWTLGFDPSPVQVGVALCAMLVLSAWLTKRVGETLTQRLRAVSNVLTAYREGDFAIRVRQAPRNSPFGEMLWELNELGVSLRKHRLGEMEAWSLLRKVMEEVRVMVLAFDEQGRIKLANAEAARVLSKRVEELVLEEASHLGLADLLDGPASRTIKDSAVLGNGRWELRRGAFRLAGAPHALVVLSDVSGALREEEREAWKRLIRVIGHEINNSLSPIYSVAENLQSMLAQPHWPDDWQEDLSTGLSIVVRRAQGLARLMGEYAHLARLPPPKLEPMSVKDWVVRVSELERRLQVEVLPSPTISIFADEDQLDQLLINVIKNAVEASLERQGGVRVHWALTGDWLDLYVDDDGPGVAETSNLFVPFFTTKIGGSGIGLVLARQIAEAHGGNLGLSNRNDGSGARAVVTLPLRQR